MVFGCIFIKSFPKIAIKNKITLSITIGKINTFFAFLLIAISIKKLEENDPKKKKRT